MSLEQICVHVTLDNGEWFYYITEPTNPLTLQAEIRQQVGEVFNRLPFCAKLRVVATRRVRSRTAIGTLEDGTKIENQELFSTNYELPTWT